MGAERCGRLPLGLALNPLCNRGLPTRLALDGMCCMFSDRADQGGMEPHQTQHLWAGRQCLSPGQSLSVARRGFECVL